MRKVIFFIIIGTALAASSAALAQGLAGIEFPIAELDNCESKEACKTYCDNPQNIETCVAFAESHGLMDKDSGEKARKMARGFQSQDFSGPGGCSTHNECRDYCNNSANADECLAFAESHGMMDERELGEARKMTRLMREGSTPGGCSSRQACEAYCFSGDNFEECSAFAVENDLASEDEVAIMKKIMSDGGPGGCRSPRECEEFCNTSGNMETCMRFAVENGLIPEEQIEHMKDGVARMRQGLQQMPPEIRACVETALGADLLEKIERGEFIPGPELGMKMRTCFERFQPQLEIHTQQRFHAVNDEVVACLRDSVSDEVIEQVKNGVPPSSPEVADQIRACFEVHAQSTPLTSEDGLTRVPPEVAACLEGRVGKAVVDSIQSGGRPTDIDPQALSEAMRACFKEFVPMPPEREGFTPPLEIIDLQEGNPGPGFRPEQEPGNRSFNMPPEIIACIDEIYGEGTAERMRNGENPPPNMEERVRACLESRFEGN